jgi:hypothetical protein
MPDIAQTCDKVDVGFFYRRDALPGTQRPMTIAVTVDSASKETGITVTKDPSETWITVPATINHGTPFDVTFNYAALVSAGRERNYRRTMTLTFSKAGYEDLVLDVTAEVAPDGVI